MVAVVGCGSDELPILIHCGGSHQLYFMMMSSPDGVVTVAWVVG
jgi:hypothetical protein